MRRLHRHDADNAIPFPAAPSDNRLTTQHPFSITHWDPDMTSIDLAQLLAPCSAELPCGPDLEYRPEYVALLQDAAGTPEVQYGDMQQDAQEPDWRDIAERAQQLLTRSHDLRLAVLLTRALIALDGLAGLEQGLMLLDGLLRQDWAGLHPQLDPEDGNDPTERINTLMALCDRDEALKRLRQHELLVSRSFGPLTLRALEQAGEADADVTALDTLANCCRDSAFAHLETLAGRFAHCLQLTTALETAVNAEVGIVAGLSLTALTQLLTLGQRFVTEQLPRHPDWQAPAAVGDETGTAEGCPAPGSDSTVNNRQDVLRALARIGDYYARHEPGSPVPMLLQRVERLVPMDFIEIIEELAPGALPDIQQLRGRAAESTD